ncbi:MAG: arylesterase, partial [Nitrosomonas sp.]|nr:arylesterase [Nitrosomonas sp.]
VWPALIAALKSIRAPVASKESADKTSTEVILP